MAALPIADVLPGTLIFLECGCRGTRGVNPPDGPFLVVVQHACPEHAQRGQAHLRAVDRWELVSPLARFDRL